jgi:Tol biopolymer transport system component
MRAILLLVLLLLAGCERNPHDPEPGITPLELLIVSGREDNVRHLYAVSADGRAGARLTHPPGTAFAGRWSPDGQRIVFVRESDMQAETGEWRIVGQIYLMNADGSNPVRLTNQPMYDDFPDWSPDGRRILFSRQWSHDFGIFVMDADGSNLVQLTRTGWRDGEPRWSPNGQKIAFLSNRGGPMIGHGPMRLHLMDADGSNLVQLPAPHFSRDVDRFAWMPDGQSLAFAFAESFWRISSAPGASPVSAPEFPADMINLPVWSPDGRRLAFTSQREHPQGGFNVFVMNSDGTDVQNITRDQGFFNVVTSWRAVP